MKYRVEIISGQYVIKCNDGGGFRDLREGELPEQLKSMYWCSDDGSMLAIEDGGVSIGGKTPRICLGSEWNFVEYKDLLPLETIVDAISVCVAWLSDKEIDEESMIKIKEVLTKRLEDYTDCNGMLMKFW